MKRTLWLLLVGLFSYQLCAAELILELKNSHKRLSSELLLAHPQVQTISITQDVSYKRSMQYRAIPMAALLEGIADSDHLQIRATDGFTAELSAAPLLAKTGSKAWLAIEDPVQRWPRISTRTPSAGPFYLVWQNPELSGISPEQWPFQIAAIKQMAPVSVRFPKLLPAATATASVQSGFAQFTKNCLACHRLNDEGDAQFGPDLNLPYNPTEYFNQDFLRQYIRDPQSLRRWPQAKMPGFSVAVMDDLALNDLISYLRHMAHRKAR